MKLVHINKVGGDLYVVREAHLPTDPGYGGGLPANPEFPDNSLPAGPPPHVPQGNVVVLVRDPAGVWHYAMMPAASVPPPLPDNTLPGGPPLRPGMPLPPTATPKA